MKKIVGNPMVLVVAAVIVIAVGFLGYSYINSDIDASVDLATSAGVTAITEIPLETTENYERISQYLGVPFDTEIKSCIDKLDYQMFEVDGGNKQTLFDDYKAICTNDGYEISPDQAWSDPGYSAISFYAKNLFFGRLVIVLSPASITAANDNTTVSGGADTSLYPITSDFIVITSNGFLSGYSSCKIGE